MSTITTDQREQRSPPTSSSVETDALRSLFPQVVATTILLLVVILWIRGDAGPKVWDRVAFVSCVGGAFLLSLRFLRTSSTRSSRLAILVGVGGMLWGIARVEQHDIGGGFFPWEGFGLSVALLSVPVALLIVPVSVRVRRTKALSRALGGVALALAAIDLFSLVRDLRDFPIASNNIFILNEVLAPSAGRVPGANFIPQYTNLLGWIFVPFRHLMSTYALANTAAITLSCLGIAAVGLGVVVARRTLPDRSLWIAIGLTVPFATVTALHSTIDSSIGSYFQELPVRMFPAMLYSVFAVTSLMALVQHSVRKVLLGSLGLLAGVMVWNSQDFGIAVAVSYLAVLLIATRGSVRTRATTLWLGGLIVGAILYPLWAEAIGHPLQLKFFGITARAYQSGFESQLIQIPGPVLLVLPVILGSVAVGGTLLSKAARGSVDLSKSQQFAVVTLAFVGMWSTVGFVYYLNLSSASAQLQLFLLPVGVCCCGLLSLCQTAMLSREPQADADVGAYLKSRALWLLPVTLPIAVGFGAILQSPSPSISIDALTHPAPSNGFLASVPTREVVHVIAYARSHGGGSVGYFGPNANYLALSTGVNSRVLFDDPGDFSLSPTARQLGCAYVRHHPTRWLVVGSTVGAISVAAHAGPRICGAYTPWTVQGEPAHTVLKLRAAIPRR